nr:MAG TPA: AAA domain protein [Caudoviricetes sp.]
MKEPVKGVTRCGKSLLCEVQILTSLFPVISHRIVQRMAR